MDNENFHACQLAIRERIKTINLLRSRNAPQSDRTGLVQLAFAIFQLAIRYIEPPKWPSHEHEVDDGVRLNWELEWYMKYVEATAEICKAAQIAVREKRLTLRSTLTRTALEEKAYTSWLNMDIDGELSGALNSFFPNVSKRNPMIGPWPDSLCVPPGAAFAQDIAAWADGDGMMPAANALALLTGTEPVPSIATRRPVAPARQNTHRNLLTPTIETAQRGESDPFDTPAIWAKLQDMAEKKIKPLLGKTDEGIQWLDENDEPKYLTLKILRDRLGRQKRATQKSEKAQLVRVK